MVNTNFILQMDAASGQLLREQFNSRIPDPDYKENVAKGLLGVTTNEDMDRSQSVILYDQFTNELFARFDVDARFLEGLKQRTNVDGSACFEFSPNGELLYVGIGNNIYKWTIKAAE